MQQGDKEVRQIQEYDMVQQGDRKGRVQAVNGDAVMVLFEGEHQNDIVDRSTLTLITEGETEKPDQGQEQQNKAQERGPDQTLTPGLHTNEQRFGSEILRDKLSSDDGE